MRAFARCDGISSMGIKVALEHRTSYTFDRLVEVYPHVVRLRPAPHSRTPIEAYSLQVEPGDHFINWQQDAFGNFLARLVFPTRARSLTITVGLDRRHEGHQPVRLLHRGLGRTYRLRVPQGADRRPQALPASGGRGGRGLGSRRPHPGVGEELLGRPRNPHHRLPGRAQPRGERRRRLQRADGTGCADAGLHPAHRDRVVPRLGVAAGVDPAPDGAGGAVRLGLPGAADLRRGGARRAVRARPPTSPTCTPGPRCTSPARDGSGWTRRRGCSRARATFRCRPRRIPESAAPITGATEPCETTLDFSNVVTRVHEDPRVTLPYTEAAWGAICALGARVDERLAAGDVRLTVGGEPTFVSIDNQVDPEWTTDADGPHKRERASELAARLKKLWAPQGLVQRSQGKWYPGEPLPRWQIGLYWRTDGKPLWTDEALLADPWQSGPAAGRRRARRRPQVLERHRRRARACRPPRCARPTRTRSSRLASAGPATRGRARRGRRRSGGRRRRPPRRAAGPARRARQRARRLRAAAAPPRRRLRLGQRRLAAAPRSHRAARRRFAGRAAAAAELDQLASAAARRTTPTRWPPAMPLPVGPGDRARRSSRTPSPRRRPRWSPRSVDGLLYIYLPPTEELEHFVDLVSRVGGGRREGRLPGGDRRLRDRRPIRGCGR